MMSYLAATLYINRLCQESPRRIFADENSGSVFDNVVGEIKNFVKKHWDSDNVFGSIIGFMGPGILATLGFPWIAVAYEVADALGFDWAGFWKSLGSTVVDIVKGTIGSKEKPTEEEMHAKIAEATEQELTSHIDENKVDEEKLAAAQKKAGGETLPKSAGGVSISYLVKQAGLFGAAAKSRGVLAAIFKKIIPWVVTRGLISLGLVAAAGAVRGVVGLKTEPKGESPEAQDKSEQFSKTRDPIYSLQLSPSADPDLFEFNRNDASSVWLENGNILNISNTLWSWILSAYPSLNTQKNNIINSSSFIEVENMFRSRNKMAQGLQIYSVPKPFQRKIDVVAYVINNYLKSK